MKTTPNRANSTGAAGEQLSFLPPPPFAPTWPRRGTLADRALGRFMNGEMLDTPDFLNVTQSWRLAAVVFQLRALGWPVETIDIPSPTDDNPARVVAEALALNGGAS